FYWDWWLDAVCQYGRWEVALTRRKDGAITAVLPYYLTRMRGQLVNIMPMFTPVLGAWITYPPNMSRHRQYSYEKKTIEQLIAQLPTVTYSVQHFPYHYQNAQPLHWLGYRSSLRYSYVLPDLSDLSAVYGNFAGRLRSSLRKASEQVQVHRSDDVERLYAINRLTFERQRLSMPYTFAFVERLDRAVASRQQRTIYFATDSAGQTHAAIYVIWDAHTTYYLIGGGDPLLRKSGAMQLLVWEAIQDAAARGHSFDFEGSMLEQVAFSFQSFGATLTPYIRFYRPKNRWWATVWTLMGKE
ncbi:MAG: GNAT family N-acetyltransferase, partial [Bacteroidota bacterium]